MNTAKKLIDQIVEADKDTQKFQAELTKLLPRVVELWSHRDRIYVSGVSEKEILKAISRVETKLGIGAAMSAGDTAWDWDIIVVGSDILGYFHRVD